MDGIYVAKIRIVKFILTLILSKHKKTLSKNGTGELANEQ